MAQWAVAMGKQREGGSSSMGKGAEAAWSENPSSQTQEAGTGMCWHKAQHQPYNAGGSGAITHCMKGSTRSVSLGMRDNVGRG